MATRNLTAVEITEATLVFGLNLKFDLVRVSENATWPDTLAIWGAKLRKSIPATPNAVTLGHRSFFPRVLRTSAADLAGGFFDDMGWLIHELTHAWQEEQIGIAYLAKALSVQLRLGTAAYDYGGAAGLTAAGAAGKRLKDFNMEQQGDIARAFYLRSKAGQDASAWAPFVAEFRTD
jgi:hypothetical protein